HPDRTILDRRTPSLPLLRIPLRLMIYFYFDLIDTLGASLQTFCRLPRRLQDPDLADLLQRKAAPVSATVLAPESALTFAAILITQNPQPAFFVSAQHVWAQ